MVPSPTPCGLPFLEIGGLQLSYPLLSQEQVKLRTSNLADTLSGPTSKSPIKILEKRKRGRIQGLPKFFGYPLFSQERAKLRTSKFRGYIYRANPNKSPLKVLEKRKRGRIQGLPKFFGYPLLSQERVKLRTSNFVGTFIGSIRT